MINMYKSETREFRWDDIRIHPSTWHFSALTREIFAVIFATPGIVISAGIMFGIANPVTISIGFFLIFLLIFIVIRFFRSYKIKGETYNTILFPLEKRFNRMSKKDQKACRHFLESAYAMCGHRGEMDKTRLTKIEKLFKLKEIQANVLYDALDEEFQYAEEVINIRKQAQKEIEMIQLKAKQ